MSVMLSGHQKAPGLKSRWLKWLKWLLVIILFLLFFFIIFFYYISRNWPDFSHKIIPPPFKPHLPPPTAVPRQCGAGQTVPPDQKVPLLEVKMTKTRLLSAYQEHRSGKREVRVIAVVLRSEEVKYRCHFCCQDKLHVYEDVYSSIHKDHFGFAYGTADIMCPLPANCEKASHIAVTSAEQEPEDKLKFLEVKNREEKSDSFPFNFTVCLSTMFDFTNVLQLVQSLEMMQLLGVNRVAIYKTNNSPETQGILDYYTNKGLVEVIPWTLSKVLRVSRSWKPDLSPGEIHYHGQIPALNDCLYRYMYQSRYVALQDIDELILPQSVSSWLELLPLLEEKYKPDRCYMFENHVFPTTFTLPPPESSQPDVNRWQNMTKKWQKVTGVNILAHLHQEPIDSETHNSNFKVIVNPRVVFTASVHGLPNLVRDMYGCEWVDRSIARMYHTREARQQLTPDKLVYDGRLLSYSDKLAETVDYVLQESGLLPKDGKQ